MIATEDHLYHGQRTAVNAARWDEVSPALPCLICGKNSWCSVSGDGNAKCCRRVQAEGAQIRVDKNGEPYYLYVTPGLFPLRPHFEVAMPPEAPKASAEQCGRVYSALLELLHLELDHRTHLIDRGFKPQNLEKNSYRSLPIENRYPVVEELEHEFGADLLSIVPGFSSQQVRKSRIIKLIGAAGILIPSRDIGGRIQALKIRRTAPRPGEPKYVYLSSKSQGGPGSGSHVHVPLFGTLKTDLIRLTEGELKADLTTCLSGIPTISIPGVSAWRQAIPVLKELGAKTVRLAFDSDAKSNPVVARALSQSAAAISDAGFVAEVETWA